MAVECRILNKKPHLNSKINFMKNSDEIIIRKAEVTDIDNLVKFFVKAYGNQTVFQDKSFLLYYFDSFNKKSKPFNRSLIAVSPEGEIVSHYGGLFYELKLNQKIISMIWGVNAYTLPDWRGKQINSKIVNFIHNNNEANAVIGMPFEAPFFYKKLGYNIFDKKTLNRFIYVFDSRAFDISVELDHDIEEAKKLLKIHKSESNITDYDDLVELTKDNFRDFDFDFDLNVNSIITTNRDVAFLNWRLFSNPFINYKVYGFLKNNKIITYIAVREEILEPNNLKVTRVIDLFGDNSGITTLLNHIINTSSINDSVYIDFSMFGKLYEKELLSSGFSKLENDEVCILPMVSSPIENRPNHEFVVIQSKNHDKEIQNLSFENVYFTRIDGDRDRIARITQLV